MLNNVNTLDKLSFIKGYLHSINPKPSTSDFPIPPSLEEVGGWDTKTRFSNSVEQSNELELSKK